MSQTDELADWLTPLLKKLDPGQRLALARELGRGLRQRQAERIKNQKDPDGAAFVPRKPRPRNKTKTGPMFAQLRQYKYLKFKARTGEISVGWFSHAAHVARIHNDGLTGTVDKKYGNETQYPMRELLGLTDDDMDWLQDTVLDWIAR